MSLALKILSVIGGILAAVLGVAVLGTAIKMTWEFAGLFDMMPARIPETGSGGIGAVSVGISESVVFPVLVTLIPSVVVNRILVRRARLEGIRRPLYRTHSLLLLLIAGLIAIPLALAVATPVAVSAPTAIALGVVVWLAVGVQFLVLAAMLMMVVRSRKRA